MTTVMGLDRHRAQITTEWVDTVTGLANASNAFGDSFGCRFHGRPAMATASRSALSGLPLIIGDPLPHLMHRSDP
jgi:hypothetical protein